MTGKAPYLRQNSLPESLFCSLIAEALGIFDRY
jgi:hypothetical protein